MTKETDSGLPYGKTEGQPQKTGVIFKEEGGQTVTYNGAGDKTWFINTTSGNVTVTLPGASTDAGLGVDFTINRVTGGANALNIITEGGQLNGTATYSLAASGNSVTFRSNGTDYWPTAQPTAADVITSASLATVLATVLAPYLTSNSFSAAIAIAAYVTSNSISAAVVTDALTVRGAAAVSATLSAAAVTVLGKPVGAFLLAGPTAITNVNSLAFSGSWSNIAILELVFHGRGSGANVLANIAISTDGGSSTFLILPTGNFFGSAQSFCKATIVGGDNRATKVISAQTSPNDTVALTATATAGYVNYIRFALNSSITMSSGFAYLYGYSNA